MFIEPCRSKSEDNREILRKAVQKILNLKYGKLFNSFICISIHSTFHSYIAKYLRGTSDYTRIIHRKTSM